MIFIMKTVLLSSLAKVFPDCAPNYGESASVSVLKNEGFSFQLAFMPEVSSEETVKISVRSPFGDGLSVYLVKSVPAGRTCYDDSDGYFLNKNRKAYPDLLSPLDNGKCVSQRDIWTSVWFKISPESVNSGGVKKITVTLKAGKSEIKKIFTAEVIDAVLPEQTLLHTNWFHNDCLCTRYGAEPFSPEYWTIAENYIRNAVNHGVNMLLTPIFTPPLDTEVGGERPTVQLVDVVKKGKDSYSFGFENFRKYIKLCLDCGIKAFEISHLFTQWGAFAAPKVVALVNGKEEKIFGWDTKAGGKAYIAFLGALAPQLKREIEELDIKDKCWFHVSDEPSLHQIGSYRRAAKLIKELFSGYNTFDALSNIEFYKKGLIKTPVPNVSEADEFYGKTEDFWTYYCCGQHRNFVPNRFFAMPSLRNRILGFQLYRYNAKGFLHWGYNFWYSQYSKSEIDPYKVTDAGGSFPGGDAFVVYPGEDGKPLNSLRFEVFAEGLQDMRALQLLEILSSRRYALEVLNRDLDAPLSMSEYPHSVKWFSAKREEINSEIKQLISIG